MKKQKYRLLVMVLCLILCSLWGSYGIYAYLTDGDAATNRFTIGGVSTSIEEKFPAPIIRPGAVLTKNVKMTNNGSCTAYVRIRVVFSDSDMEQWCTLNYDESGAWVYGEDGFWYYTQPLAVKESTGSLFTKVTISNALPEEEIKEFTIMVYAESYQAAEFASYEEAWQNYEKNKPV